MDRKDIERLAKDPRFVPGIYNYCDRWCERCSNTSRCMNYAMSEGEDDSPESRDMNNKAFWDKLGEIFKITMEMLYEKAEELGINLDEIDEELEKQSEQVREMAKERPYSRDARAYIEMVNEWMEANRGLFENKEDELNAQVLAQIPDTKPAEDAADIKDCFEVICWYQHQIYVKLCRAASGMIRGELAKGYEYFAEDAKGSAGVAVLGIERSIAAWGKLLNHFPEQERSIFGLLVHLKGLLRQVKEAFA